MEIAKASFRSVVDTCWEAIDSIIYRGSKQEIRDAIRYGSTAEVVHLVNKCNCEQVIRDAICYCIELGNTDLLQCILQRIDSSDKERLIITKQCREDHSPLHIACKLGNQEAVLCLLNKGFLVNIVDRSNQTPLWVAISEGHHSVTEMLLANTEIDVNVYVKQSVKGTRENQNITVLLQAAILDDMKSVIALCHHNPDTNVEDATGKTALHYTSCNGRTEGVRTLLHCGADINKLTKDFESPLYLACQKGHAEVARLLLESGAIINKTEKRNEHTSQLTCQKYPLISAIENCHTNIVSLLISHGADIHLSLSNGRRPLHIACSVGTLETVKVILKSRGDVNIKDSQGQTPLFYCLRNGIFQIAVRFYRIHNKDSKRYQTHKIDEYLELLKEGNKIMEYLLKRGAIVNCTDIHGLSPLDHGMKTHRHVTTFILLKYGGKTDRKYYEETSWLINETYNNEFTNVFLLYILIKHELKFRNIIPMIMKRSNIITRSANDFIFEEFSKPASLKDQTRIIIRNSIHGITGKEFESNIHGLPLPKTLKAFLVYNEIEPMLNIQNEIL
ncbi:transient receptor potential cation channel subfamily A member 1-like [Mytilus galloprovincialis]|uniref:transient receptor potential cation channel subfamily A member 1-like n=1 Tax=Mytilus galloprovincialis TaxID=29158 RepID=UPI003F7B4A19